ncbi:MAG: hypothetical protein HQL12_04570 [Candidatus Omnitrophica bacterium]|nr:hypothetical protein [Candidatus Omnitrophota bacterium]
MKRILAIVLALLFMAAFSMPSFAAKASKDQKYDRIVAQVVSVDAAAKTMVVKEEKSGASRTIKISAKASSQINAGDRVRIKLKPGTDESVGVRVLKDHSKDKTGIPPEPKTEPVPTVPEKK